MKSYSEFSWVDKLVHNHKSTYNISDSYFLCECGFVKHNIIPLFKAIIIPVIFQVIFFIPESIIDTVLKIHEIRFLAIVPLILTVIYLNHMAGKYSIKNAEMMVEGIDSVLLDSKGYSDLLKETKSNLRFMIIYITLNIAIQIIELIPTIIDHMK